MRILLIEDNFSIAQAIRVMLTNRKFALDLAADGDVGLDYLLRQTYDAAIVDVVLPKQDGFSVTKAARAHGLQTPILMLTARDAVEDRVRGLDSGADDYLVKPFVESELVARLNALIRRGDRPVQASLHLGDLNIDLRARSAAYAGTALTLGSTEFRMLELFVRNAGQTFSRQQVLERIWDYDFEGASNIVDVYVSQLRKKLKDAGANDVIETVWGIGYTVRRRGDRPPELGA